MPKLALKIDGNILDQIPCEPANIVAILQILDEREPSIHAMVPFFEQDLVLTLKALSLANYMMKQRSSKAIAVRNVSHALTIIGFTGVKQLIQRCLVCDAKDQSLYFQVYRFTLTRAHFLLSLLQSLCVFHPALNQDDIRLYVSILMLGQLWLGREKTEIANVLFFLHQREPVDFWSAEMEMLGTTVMDISVKLSDNFDLPEDARHLFETMPSFEQFFYGQDCLNLRKIQQFLRKKNHTQDITLSIVALCYCLVHRSPMLYGDSSTWFMIHWLARFLKKSPHEIWSLVQIQMQKACKTYPLLAASSRALFLPGSGVEVMKHNLDELIAGYRSLEGLQEMSVAVNIAQAKKMPVIKALANATVELWHAQNQLKPSQPAAPNKRPTVRAPDQSIERFIHTINSQPNAYGAKLPTASALLEALRIGLGAAFGLALFFDKKKGHFWVGCVTGLASLHPIRQWTVPTAGAGLLNHFLEKPVGLYLHGEKKSQVLKAIPKLLVSTIGPNEALLCSTKSAQKNPTGLIIMVAHAEECFSKDLYASFQKAVFQTNL